MSMVSQRLVTGCLQPPLVPRALRAFALASAGNFFSLIETKLREGQLSYVYVEAYHLTPLLCFGEYQAHTHLAAAVCCLANKEAKRSSTLCPSWSRSCT